MTTATIRRRTAVPVVAKTVDARSAQLSELIERAGVAMLNDGGLALRVVFALAAFDALRKDVENMELEAGP